MARGAPFRVCILNSCGNGRRLDFRVEARDDGSYQVQRMA